MSVPGAGAIEPDVSPPTDTMIPLKVPGIRSRRRLDLRGVVSVLLRLTDSTDCDRLGEASYTTSITSSAMKYTYAITLLFCCLLC